jgi:branched-chain amino acid transport system ATP-binding protein
MSLVVEGVTLHYGGVVALDAVSLRVEGGERLALVGPNGAGKSSLLNVITGLVRPAAGSVRLDGRELVGLGPRRVARAGIARTFQEVGLFSSMTVLENLMAARYTHGRSGAVEGALGTGRARRERREARLAGREILAGLGLEGVADRPVSVLPYGTRKRVEVARALATEPGVLLLDEPGSGADEEDRRELADSIRALSARRPVAVLIIDHDLPFVFGLADRVVVLDFGRVVASGSPDDVRDDRSLLAAYLGPEP